MTLEEKETVARMRIREINEELKGLRGVQKVVIQNRWLAQIDGKLNRGSFTHSWWKDPLLANKLLAERKELKELIVQLGRENARKIFETELPDQPSKLKLSRNDNAEFNQKIVEIVEYYIDKGKTRQQAFQSTSDNAVKHLKKWLKLSGINKLTPRIIEGRYKRNKDK